MKKSIRIFLFLLPLISFAFTDGETKHILYPGKGMDENIVFKKTTRDEIVKLFGTDFTISRSFIKSEENPNDSTLNRLFLEYPKTGIRFVFASWDTNSVVGISVNKLFPAKTDKGFEIGELTMQEVEITYGKTEWSFTGKSMFKQYSGIAFCVPFDGKFPVSKQNMEAAEKKKISEIDIYFGYVNLNY